MGMYPIQFCSLVCLTNLALLNCHLNVNNLALILKKKTMALTANLKPHLFSDLGYNYLNRVTIYSGITE